MSNKWFFIFLIVFLLIAGLASFYLLENGTTTEQSIIENKTHSVIEKPKSEQNLDSEQKNSSENINIKIADKGETSKEKLNSTNENNVKANDLDKKDNEVIPTEKSNIISFPVIVKNEAGELLENAQLDLVENNSKKIFCSFKTNKRGQATLLFEKPKQYQGVSLTIRHQIYASKFYPYFDSTQYSTTGPLIIVLIKGTAIKGIARDASGVLLEGIEIQLQKQNEYFGNYTTVNTTKSKANGVFEFANVAPGKISFLSLGQNYIFTDSKTYTAPNNENIILTFQKARKRLLKVTNTDGVGIAKAKVTYFLGSQNLAGPTRTETDANGFCYLFLSKERAKELIIDHSDYISYNTNDIYNSHETEPENIILMKGNKLSVQIKDKKTGQMINYAIVNCTNDTKGFYPNKIGETGNYEFESLAEDAFFISVRCSGYNPIIRYSIVIEPSSKNFKTLELELAKHFNIKLIDAITKMPLTNKTFYNLNDRLTKDPMQTNEFGESSLPIDENSNSPRINIQAEGYASIDQTVSATDETTTVELFPSATLFVFIIDPLNHPLDEIALWCEYNSKTSNEKGALNTIYNSEKHCFLVEGLIVGKAELTFQSNSSAPINVSIDLVVGNENKLDLTLKPKDLLICKIKSSDSQINLSEMAGKVEFHSSNSSWYYDGQNLEFNEEKNYFTAPIYYEFNDSFTIKFPQHLQSANTVIQPASEVPKVYEFILSKGLGVEGEILNGKGKLIIDARIEFEPVERDGSERNWTTTDEFGEVIPSSNKTIRNENGKFSAYGYVAGKYKVKATHFDYLSYEKEIELTNQSKTDLQIILKKGAQVSGVIADFNGKLVIGAKLKLTSNEGREYYTGTNFKGEFIFKCIPPGSNFLSCSSLSGNLEKFEINISDGQDIKDLSITLEKNLEISGTVCDDQGNKLNKISVNLYSPDSNQNISQTTDETGTFKFSNTTKNQYSVNIYSQEGYKLDSAVTLIGGDLDVKLVLKIPNRKLINGHVYTPDGKECLNYELNYVDVDTKNEGNIIDQKKTANGYQGNINLEQIQTVKIIARAIGFSQGESEEFNLPQYAEQPILITLKNKIILDLKIIDAFSRLPITKANANISSSYNSNQWWLNENSGSDDKGFLQLKEGLTIGKGTLTVKAAGYVETSLEIEVAEKNSLIEVALGKGGTIKGQILDAENKPIPFISVKTEPLIAKENDDNNYFYGQRITNKLKTTSDESGFYEIKLVPPGKYFVRTESASRLQPKGFFAGLLVTIEEGKEINLSKEELIAYTKSSKINLTLTGTDVAKKSIAITKTKPADEVRIGFSLEAISNQEGKAYFLDIPLGEYIITINDLAEPISQSVVVKDGTEINLEIATK